MKIGIYDRYSSHYLLLLLFVLFGASAGICIFSFTRFLESGYDVGWLFLAAMFTTPFILALVVEIKEKVISRYLLRLEISEQGICCRGFLSSAWFIPWSSVRTYGVSGYSRNIYHVPIMFFSTNPNELFDKKKDTNIDKNRIVISIRDETWPALGRYMPSDMERNLQWSVENHRDCFYKRKPKETRR